LTAIAFKTE